MARQRHSTVRYDRLPDGTLDITVLHPDATQLRIDGYPEDIRTAAQSAFHATLTPLERLKIKAAERIGEPAYTAVWDDLVSQRAEALLRASPSHPEFPPHGIASNQLSTCIETRLERER